MPAARNEPEEMLAAMLPATSAQTDFCHRAQAIVTSSVKACVPKSMANSRRMSMCRESVM